MGTLSIWHILILVIVALLLFGGRGKLSDLMGDVAKGITSFRKGLQDADNDHHDDRRPPPTISSDRDKDQVGR
ncbi:MAG TPA: twin-arginine translocase TatA/TatE family subunit [Rhizomicrobium sp.]|nr:twin-arginine translocase TatA/TatE family subunit [Rhizomicrobium sp.]